MPLVACHKPSALLRPMLSAGLLILFPLLASEFLMTPSRADAAEDPWVLLVCDSTGDRVVRLGDADGSGTADATVPGEICVFYDDSSPGPDLSTPSHMAAGPDGTIYLLDGGTLDAVLVLSDQNGDGDANDNGEVAVFYDASGGGPSLSTPNTLIPDPGGGYYLSDDGSKARRILKIQDQNGDGDALESGEARIVYDGTAASQPVLQDVESLGAAADGTLYAADCTLQAIFALKDEDGDGAFLSEGETMLFFQGGEVAQISDMETILVVDGQVFAAGRKSGRLLRLVDSNSDGDALDEGEAISVLDDSAAWKIQDVTGLIPLPDGSFLILENATDTVLLLKDLDGDGDALDEGEVLPWLMDGGESLSLPSGCLRIRGEATPPLEGTFVRGDATHDGTLDLTDPVATLGFLFLGGALENCQDALDADDDGEVTISDAIGVLNFLFLGGQPPSPPYPDAGTDPTEDSMRC